MSLKGFSGETVQLAGMITLSVQVGSAPSTAPVMVDFLVVRASSSYNAIIGRPTLNKLKAITSTYHLKELKPKTKGTTNSVNMRLSRSCDKLLTKMRAVSAEREGEGNSVNISPLTKTFFKDKASPTSYLHAGTKRMGVMPKGCSIPRAV
ncbi:hypothetical protein F2P56_030376 [Juglans regia]|uniref:Uncharacterized protein n=2 Tax=Juglans regia TaxID=51240 RepID=A0A833U3X7_JUGRE|nr:uncharacterized protein LOC109006502 [Juglans regia]KAF5449988.1 hypothetical protein F2P56_030376 [Juglans regia]